MKLSTESTFRSVLLSQKEFEHNPKREQRKADENQLRIHRELKRAAAHMAERVRSVNNPEVPFIVSMNKPVEQDRAADRDRAAPAEKEGGNDVEKPGVAGSHGGTVSSLHN